MRVFTTTMNSGIRRTPEFEKKGLASFAVNVGTKCGHDCLYCSTGSLLRMHKSFSAVGESPFGFGYSIVDPHTPERVAQDASRLRARGLVQLCTTVDAWAPEAQAHDLGRRCLEAILSEPGWTVRILTKNAAVRRDFDVIEKHRDRVVIGLSLTGTRAKEAQLSVVERNASPIGERMAAMEEACARGLRTYGMLCPLLPGIADDDASIRELVRFCLSCKAEEVFAEPVNARGAGLRLVQFALEESGFRVEADAVRSIRKREAWSAYCRTLVASLQDAMTNLGALSKLRFLLYPDSLHELDRREIERRDDGVRWLGK
jgi:DNA repair photolyase